MAENGRVHGYVMYADPAWLAYHAEHSLAQQAVYVRGVGAPMKSLVIGSPIFLIRKGENPRRVHGYGWFSGDEVATLSEAWNRHGDRLGAADRESWHSLLRRLPNTGDVSVRLIVLDEFSIPREPLPIPAEVHTPPNPPKGWGLDRLDAEMLQRLLLTPPRSDGVPDPELEEAAACGLGQEGMRRLRTHLEIERRWQVVRQAKQVWTQIDPLLRCEVCRFSFASRYGTCGEGFIEAHHRTPLAQLDGPTVTRVTDLAPVCSNCHRMLHRRGGCTINELRAMLQNR